MGCDASRSGAPAPDSHLQDAGATGGALECLRPDEGCACEDGADPVPCYLPPQQTENGIMCHRGVHSCRDGVWSACESLVQYPLRLLAGLVTEPTVCNPCRPDCFETTDRPTDEDLTDTNSHNVQYDPDLGGLILIPTSPPPVLPTVCGDGAVEGLEECDDGNAVSGDGCSADCRFEDGFVCDVEGQSCRRTICGDGLVEGTEPCDDGNLLIGDGCTPFCQIEPDCSSGVCQPVCGDGRVYPGQQCDDGNVRDGDGCSSTCTIEEGFVCETVDVDPPDAMDLPIVIRDFRAGHTDFQNWCCGLDTGMVEDMWGPDRKPVPIIAPAQNPSLSTEANFLEWYNTAPSNITVPDQVRVTRQADGSYVFDSAAFFPIDGMGWTLYGEPEPFGHNYHFTTELRFWFIYEPGQYFRFRGDDDIWVFINGRLVVDLGGVHGPLTRDITLDATTEGWLGLTPGELYEGAVFHAERHTAGSNYQLTLEGFFFGRTECESICGDGIVTRYEVCDDGVNDGSPGTCLPDCQGYAVQYGETGFYRRVFDASATCAIPPTRPDWGELSWEVQTPGDSRVRFDIRTASTASGLSSATPVSFSVPAEPEVGSVDVTELLVTDGQVRNHPYLSVTAVLIPSSDGSLSPVLHGFHMQYACLYAE
jgi:fibro-slime domain-containing protein